MAAMGAFMALRTHPSAGYDFLVWLIVGLAPFLLFKNIALRIMASVEANKALFSYKQIQPADAFIARAVVEFCISALVFVLLYGSLTWYGYDTKINEPIKWLAVLSLGILLSFSIGILFAVIVNAVPESAFLLRLLFFPMYLLSGVIFSIHRIPHQYMTYVLWNPYLHIIDLLRESTFRYYTAYDGVSMRYAVECTIISLFLGCAIYRLRRFRLMAL